MLQLFRNFFKSKLGIVITLAFLGLIAVAFASSDVANTGMFGGVAGGDRVAVVGDRTISTSDLSQNANNAWQQARETNPTLTMEEFIDQGGFDEVLSQMISRTALAEFAEAMNLRAGARLVDSEIVGEPAFRGADGQFDADAFRAALRQRNLSESTVREDLGLSLLARQSVVPISYQTRLPESLARSYAGMLNETRLGRAALFPAAAFAPAEDPTDTQLQAYYDEHRERYVRPERRVIRFANFDINAVGELPPVTDAQISARYEADQVLYRATERRSFTQLVLPTEAAAQTVINEVNDGMSLSASASAKGLATTSVSEVEQEDFATTASRTVANAAFATDEGDLAGPVQGSLGWYVLRVDNVTEIPARPLADVSAEIRSTLEAERRREALNELTERLEDEFARGRSLEDAAEELGVEITSTPQLLANGQVYGQPEQAPRELARIVNFAFELDANEPQIAEIVPGTVFLVFDVGEIARSATAPLDEIREDVAIQWRRDRGMAGAAQAAARVLERVEGGASMAAALAEEDANLPPVQSLQLNRQELAQSQQVTRATVLFFAMAQGTTKSVVVPGTNAWYVLQLDEIRTPDLAEIEGGEQMLLSTRQQLSALLGEEYVEQFVNGAEASLDIERNAAGIDAVRAQLTGATN